MSINVNRPGFKLVSKEFFSAWLMSTKRNVHPHLDSSPRSDHQEGYISTWKDLRTHEVVGYSSKTKYQLLESEIAKVPA